MSSRSMQPRGSSGNRQFIGSGMGSEILSYLEGGRDRRPAVLLSDILDPNHDVAPDFVAVTVATERGQVLSGLLVEETGSSLKLRKADGIERAATINGVLYAVDGDDMAKFDAREQGYARVEVPREDIEAVSWQRLPETGKIWVYVPVAANGEPGVGLPEADAQFPMLESYIDVVVEGGLEYGEEFAREVLETTFDWSDYWLNDGELVRRPWVRDPGSAAIDRLLASAPQAAAKLKSRLFSEPYAIHWATQKAQ